MLYCLCPPLVFLHVPRTAGTTITYTLAEMLPSAIVVERDDKHLTAWQVAQRLGPLWDRMERLAVLRDPLAIIESDWQHTLWSHAQITTETPLHCTGFWLERMRRVAAYPSFGEFVRQEWLGPWSPLLPGGFRRTWTLGPGGAELGVRLLRYERLDEDWRDLLGHLGLPYRPLPRQNVSRPVRPAVWTPELRDAVLTLCWMD